MDANQKLLDFIMDCGVFYYANVDNGKARVRPFGFATILDGKLYFGMGDHKRSYRETVENPYVEICACKGGEWIRIRGKAVFDFVRRPPDENALTVSPRPRSPDENALTVSSRPRVPDETLSMCSPRSIWLAR